MRYDTVIIGAGLSGLAAGIRLAYYNKSVCVLERHTTIGGLNSFYRLRGRNYDVGLHAMTNYAKPGTKSGPLSRVLRQLRLKWEDFPLVPQNGSRIAFPGHELRFTNEREVLEAEIARQFPQQIDRFRTLVQQLAAVGDEALYAPSAVTARQVLGAALSDPVLIEMLLCPLMFYGSATPGDMDYHQFVIMFRSIFQEGFARPYAGVRVILKNLVRQYKSLGGELRLRAGVREILSDGDRAVGVVLDDGTTVEAEHVLSSAGLAETLQLCGGSIPEEVFPLSRRVPGDVTFLETIATLDCQPAALGHTDTIVFYNDSENFRYENPAQPCDLRSGIICSPNNFQYEEPLSEGAMRITALANKDYWMHLPEPEYVAAKQRWYEHITRAALRFVPDFQSHVIETDTFTPRTIRKFTGHIHGAVYGAPFKQLSGTTHLRNLFLCGTDQGFLGIVGSMISGISMANLHLLR